MPRKKPDGKPFYQTDSFKKLEAEWYGKLKKKGFEDIEDHRDPFKKLKTWAAHFKDKADRDRLPSKARYYVLAEHFLNENNFRDPVDHLIWDYHQQGLYPSEMQKVLSIPRSQIEARFKKLKEDFMTWRMTPQKDDDDEC